MGSRVHSQPDGTRGSGSLLGFIQESINTVYTLCFTEICDPFGFMLCAGLKETVRPATLPKYSLVSGWRRPSSVRRQMDCLVAFLWPDWRFALCSGYFSLREAVVNKVVNPPGAVHPHMKQKGFSSVILYFTVHQQHLHPPCLRPARFCSHSSHFGEAVKQIPSWRFRLWRPGCRSFAVAACFQPRSQTINHKRRHNREMAFLNAISEHQSTF